MSAFIDIKYDIFLFWNFRWNNINKQEFFDILKFPGFQALGWKYASFGMKEIVRSMYVPLQVKQIQKYIQEITTADVESGPAGVRAQALAKDGRHFVFAPYVINALTSLLLPLLA